MYNTYQGMALESVVLSARYARWFGGEFISV